MAGKGQKDVGNERNSVKEWRRKRGGRIEGKSNKKMRQQKMAGRGGGGLDEWGVKQVKKQKRGETGLEGNGVKGAWGGNVMDRESERRRQEK